MNSHFVETKTDSLKFQDSNRRLGCWERPVESSRPLLFYLVSEPHWTWQASHWNNRLPRWLSGKESTCQCRRHRGHGFDPWVGKISCRRAWQPTSVLLPGKFHGWRSLMGYRSRNRSWLSESDTHTTINYLFTIRVCRVKVPQVYTSGLCRYF